MTSQLISFEKMANWTRLERFDSACQRFLFVSSRLVMPATCLHMDAWRPEIGVQHVVASDIFVFMYGPSPISCVTTCWHKPEMIRTKERNCIGKIKHTMMRQELTTRTMVETGFPSVRYEELSSQLTQPLVYIYIYNKTTRSGPTDTKGCAAVLSPTNHCDPCGRRSWKINTILSNFKWSVESNRLHPSAHLNAWREPVPGTNSPVFNELCERSISKR